MNNLFLFFQELHGGAAVVPEVPVLQVLVSGGPVARGGALPDQGHCQVQAGADVGSGRRAQKQVYRRRTQGSPAGKMSAQNLNPTFMPPKSCPEIQNRLSRQSKRSARQIFLSPLFGKKKSDDGGLELG